MMRPTTPNGSRTEKLTTSGPIGIDEPFISVTRPAKNSICAAATMASLTISRTGLPQSAASIMRQFLGILARRISAIRRRILARSSGSTRRHSLNAALAAATAASISSAPSVGHPAERQAGAGIDGVDDSGRISARARCRRNRRRGWSAAPWPPLRPIGERRRWSCHCSIARRLHFQSRLMLSRPPRRPTSALAPIASTNSTISMAYMRGMSNVL